MVQDVNSIWVLICSKTLFMFNHGASVSNHVMIHVMNNDHVMNHIMIHDLAVFNHDS